MAHENCWSCSTGLSEQLVAVSLGEIESMRLKVAYFNCGKLGIALSPCCQNVPMKAPVQHLHLTYLRCAHSSPPYKIDQIRTTQTFTWLDLVCRFPCGA